MCTFSARYSKARTFDASEYKIKRDASDDLQHMTEERDVAREVAGIFISGSPQITILVLQPAS